MCVGRWGAGGWLCVCREIGGRGMVVCVHACLCVWVRITATQ